MSDEDRKAIKGVVKKQEKKKEEIEDILKMKEWSIEELFEKLFNEIIYELNSLNNIITDKNTKNNFSKYDALFLYGEIKLFLNLNLNKIPDDIINNVITKENINIIMKVFINVNKYNLPANNILEFNKIIINLLMYIIQNKSELLMDNMLNYKDTILPKFFLLLARNRKGREFVYDIERYILMLFPDKEQYNFYIESMNNILTCIYAQLNDKNLSSIIEEIQDILNTYKNRMNVINNSMMDLLIKIFYINEKQLKEENNKDDNFNELILNFLKYCFYRIVFTFSYNINPGNNPIKDNEDKEQNQFNLGFMNFLLDLYQSLINNKLKNSYTSFFMELFIGLDNNGDGAKRYKWLVRYTKYPQIVLESLIKLKDSDLLSLYITKIIFLSMPNKTEYYKPELDINFFFSKLQDIFDDNDLEKSQKFFHIISSQFMNLINTNNDIFQLIYTKCDIFNKSLAIFNSNKFSKDIKMNLFELLEKIVNLNTNKTLKYKFNCFLINEYELEDNFDLNDTNTYGLKYKLYLLFLESDIKSKDFIDNIEQIIKNIHLFLEKKKIFEIFVFIDMLYKSILINENFQFINEITKEQEVKINDIFLKFPSLILNNENNDSDEKIENLMNKFLDSIKSFIYLFNKKIIELKKNKFVSNSKSIFSENSLIKIFQNIFAKIINPSMKNKIISHIINYDCSNIKNNDIAKENNINYKSLILEYPFFILLILNALNNINDFETMSKIYDYLLETIDYAMVNIKNILSFDFLFFIMTFLINSYRNKDIENEPSIKNCCDKAISLLKIIVNFLTQSLLIKYLYNIFHNFYESISDFESKNNCDKSKKIILILFSILKDSLTSFYNKQKQNYQFLSLSKQVFSNPFIHNIFYINNLQIEEPIIHFNVDIRVNSFDNINKFNIVNFFNVKTKQSFFVSIDNKSRLLICENNINNDKDEIDILATFNNINNYLLMDKKFRNISIIIDTHSKGMKILIDYKNISSKKSIIHFKKFNFFDVFDLSIGYNYDEVINFKNTNSKDNTSIIDIANILLINFGNDADNFLINKQKENLKYQYDNDYVIDYLCNQKKEKHFNYILAEVCFNLRNIKIMKTKRLENLNILDDFLKIDDGKINKYIFYIDIFKPLQNKSVSKFYMCSLNQNIEEYFSINHILSLQNLNNNFFQNIFIEEQNIFISSSNYYFIDFLFGFIYDIDKRTKLLENKENNNNIKLDDENINDYILIILEILLKIKNKKILKYYLLDVDTPVFPIRMKYFFKNNIYLLNNIPFLNEFLEILLNKKENFLIFSIHILTELTIFSYLKIENQNIILINIKSLFQKKKQESTEIIDPLKKYYYDKVNKEEELSPLLLTNLCGKLINLILYYPLSNEENKENNNEKQIDIILDIIKNIIEKIKYDKNIKKLYRIKENIQNLSEVKEVHNHESFFEKNEKIIKKNNSFIDNEIIKTQRDLLNKILNEILEKPIDIVFANENNEKKDETGISDNNEGIIINFNNNKILEEELNDEHIKDVNNINEKQNNEIELKKCIFCQYLINYFKIGVNDFFEEINYEKEKKYFYRNIFLNFREYRQKLGINKYAWFLTGKESSHCIQNKLFIRENNIRSFPPLKNQKKLQGLFSYKYDNDIKAYNKHVIQLQQLFVYDKISIDNHFINVFRNNTISNNNYIIENCLLINRLYKTISLFILQNDYILILKNIFIDKENNLQVCLSKPELILWFIKDEEYLNELEKYTKKNEIELNNIFEENKKEKKDDYFGMSRNYKFSIKKIKISEISEIYKTSFLQCPNSIEIITKKGKNYFLCFNVDRRDNAFFMIIENISNKYSNEINIKNSKKITTILKKSYKSNSNEIIYMKYCPSYFSNSTGSKFLKIVNSNPKLRINKKEFYNKLLIEKNVLINDISYNWIKNRITNFDYLMFLNILSERSLTNLCQYIIFPVIICNFDQPIFNHMNKSIYRNLSLPIFVCFPSLKEDFSELDEKTEETNDTDSICHSGVFYSTYAFAAYYLIRQHPFTEIHLEIQGGEFDTGDRLFIGTNELSTLEDKHQELIPALYTLPELYVNINKFLFGKFHRINDEKDKNEFVNDFILPKWADDDQRKFSLYLLKLLESKNINQNLHSWIDLIFGYKMTGNEAIKVYNTYRKACYKLSKEEIESAYSEGILYSALFEKQEMGYIGKQLFKKQHKKREILSEDAKENDNKLFDKISEIKNLKFSQIYTKPKKDDKLIKINDIVIETTNDYIKSTINNKSYYLQGGISSLKSLMNVLSNETNNQCNKKINIPKLINSFEKESKFIFLDKKCLLLGEHVNKIFLNYNKKIIRIIYYNFNLYSLYYLNEIGNISAIIANSEGTKLYIAFDNGNIILYKLKLYLDEKDLIHESDCIYPFKNFLTLNQENNSINNSKEKIISNSKNKKIEKEEPPNIFLKKIISNNNFIINNAHIPSKIRKLGLDEKNNILIALTNRNIIYFISLNDNFKLMNTITYFTHFDYNYKMKNILTFADNGDFLIYSSVSVHLFSINGVPLCELSLLKENKGIPKISYCEALFSGDIILFTGHKDGSVIIWKLKTKKYNKEKIFLPEYNYNYSFDFDNKDIKKYELRREFEIITKVEQSDDMKIPIKYMKISNDLNYMLIINKNKNIFILSGKTEDDNNNSIKENENNIIIDENKKKNICQICKKEYDYDEENNIIKNNNNNNIQDNKDEKEKEHDFEIVDKKILVDKIMEEKIKIDDENICINCQKELENYLYSF